MVNEEFSLCVEGWIMNGYSRYVIDPGGDVISIPLLTIYADQFWNVRSQPLQLPSQPIEIEFTEQLAKQKNVWSLGERVRLTGQAIQVNVTRIRQQQTVQAVRQRIATLDRNTLAHFRTGMLKREDQLARIAKFRDQYLKGEIGLNALQNHENRIFAHERHVWLEQLALLHDKQLAMRRSALPDLLAHSRTAYLLTAPSQINHMVSGRARTEGTTVSNRSPTGGTRAVFRATPRAPAVEKKMLKSRARRAELLVPLHRFRQDWLKAGRPVARLPPVSPSLQVKQQEWLAYEEAKS